MQKVEKLKVTNAEFFVIQNELQKRNCYLRTYKPMNMTEEYRLGKKQKRAILTNDGKEVVVFNNGQEQLAELVCNLLNIHAEHLQQASVPSVESELNLIHDSVRSQPFDLGFKTAWEILSVTVASKSAEIERMKKELSETKSLLQYWKNNSHLEP